MNICLVNDYPLRYTGGAQTAMFEQKKSLEAAGHYVIILQHGRPMATDVNGIIWFKGSLSLAPFFNGMSDSWVTQRNIDRIDHILRTHNIDIVHIQSEFGLAHCAIQAARRRAIPVFHTIHTFFWQTDLPLQSALSSLLHLYSRRAYKLPLPRHASLASQLKALTLAAAQSATVVVSPSKHQHTALVEAGLTTRCITIPNVFTPQAAPNPHVVSKNQATVTFIWIGRLAPEKRILEFLSATAMAAQQATRPFKVEIVGTGPLLKKARAFIKMHHLGDTVTLHGNLAHDQVIDKLDTGSVLVLSSYHFDNQPMVIAEAVSRLRGVVYCDERLVEGLGQCGVLTKSPRPHDIAATMVKLADSPIMAHDLSVKARSDRLVFSSAHYGKAITKEYARALQKHT